jgi:hypothetical protein
MEWDYLKLFGAVGFITFAILCAAFIWDNWFDTAWHGLKVPVTFKDAFIECTIYMLVFAFLSLFLQVILRLACSVC